MALGLVQATHDLDVGATLDQLLGTADALQAQVSENKLQLREAQEQAEQASDTAANLGKVRPALFPVTVEVCRMMCPGKQGNYTRRYQSSRMFQEWKGGCPWGERPQSSESQEGEWEA